MITIMLMKNELFTYEISPLTMAIIAIENESGIINTQVFENETNYLINKSPVKIINHACRYFGSSLRDLQDVTKVINDITYKVQITNDQTSNLNFILTSYSR